MDYLLPFLFLLIAFIYSSVGLGGGSSYTALMAILGINYQIIPTTSLTLNLIVTFIGMIHFWKNGHGRLNLIIPFLVTSIPMAYFAGSQELPERIFNIFLLITLIFVVIRIYLLNDLKISIQLTRIQKWIFIYRRWKTPKKRAQKGSQRKKSFRCLAKSKNRDLEKLFISFIHMAQSEARCQINKSQFKNYLKSTVFNFLPFLIMLFCETSKINKLK